MKAGQSMVMEVAEVMGEEERVMEEGEIEVMEAGKSKGMEIVERKEKEREITILEMMGAGESKIMKEAERKIMEEKER